MLALTLLASAVLTLASCTQPSPVSSAIPEAESTVQSVTVSQRDITSVIVVEGVIVSSPQLAVFSQTRGFISFNSKALSAPATAQGATVATVAGTPIPMPFSGRIDEAVVPQGAEVVSNAIVAIATYAGFGVSLKVPAEQLFRLYAEPTSALASLTGGAAGVKCELHPGSRIRAADELPEFVCLLPPDVAAVPGLSARVGIQTAAVEDVVAVPVSSVLGSAEQGVVTVIRGSERVRVTVELGVSDGAYVEVKSGLQVGDVISAIAPDLR